ncbi:type III secretion protein, YscG family [Vibrio azureus]|uniref:Putative type III secretion system protein n=1 Tax=Vibrio azureus NBRC 104587 TaxID=1219077 RepID=U3A2W8_9VIBR|nr:YscG family type III secretion system chaperone [Vibrio azureus]AUI86008.1 type III secretion protein, YscG family [Vibrio azureus]GAD74316.1 putative type III secretion system protein [Vibrio azureus NBRC 104587]
MEQEMRLLLAEIALMATGMHQHKEANLIADSLEKSAASKEVIAMIRSMSLMNRGLYHDAYRLLAPLCTDFPDLISLAALAAGKAGLLNQAESLLQTALQGNQQSQEFAQSYLRDIRCA